MFSPRDDTEPLAFALEFKGRTNPVLSMTKCQHPHLHDKDKDGRYFKPINPKRRSFETEGWTKGPQALACFFVKAVIWGLTHQADEPLCRLTGPAEETLYKNLRTDNKVPLWGEDIFGFEQNGPAFIRKIIRVGSPSRRYWAELQLDVLPLKAVQIVWDGLNITKMANQLKELENAMLSAYFKSNDSVNSNHAIKEEDKTGLVETNPNIKVGTRNDQCEISGGTDVEISSGEVAEVEITIPGEIEQWTKEQRAALVTALVACLKLGPVKITGIRKGSVKLKLTMTADDAKRLIKAVKEGKLKEYSITAARLVKPGTWEPLPEKSFWRRFLVPGLAAAMLLGIILGGGFGLWHYFTRPTADPVGPIPVVPSTTPTGPPLSPLALVSKPTVITGLQSWSLELAGHRGAVLAVAYDRTGKRLATAGEDGTVRVWEVATGKLVNVFLGHTGVVRALAWSPDGLVLASGGADQTVRRWEIETGKCLDLFAHSCSVFAAAYSPDGKALAFAGSDSSVRLRTGDKWDDVIHLREKGYEGAINSLAWSPDSKHLACACADATIRLWNVASGKHRSLKGHQNGVMAVSWSADGKSITSVDSLSVRSWETDGKGDARLSVRLSTNPLLAAAFSPDGTLLVGAAQSGAWLADATTGKVLGTLTGDARTVSWAPDGQTVAVGGRDGSIQIWRPTQDQAERTIDGSAAFGNQPWGPLAQSPDGSYLASGHGDGTVRVWDLRDGKMVRVFRSLGGRPIVKVAWSADGQRLVAEDRDLSIPLLNFWHVWEFKTERLLGQYRVGKGFLSDDARILASVENGKTLELRDTETGKPLHTLPTGPVWNLAWSRDSKVVAVLNEKGVRFWDVENGRPLPPLAKVEEAQPGGVRSVAFSPNDKLLAVVGQDGGLGVWERHTGKCLLTPNPKQPVASVAWLPDGTTLASDHSNGTLKLWSAEPGKPVHTVNIKSTGPEAILGVSPDGRVCVFRTTSKVLFREISSGKELYSLEGEYPHSLQSHGIAWVTGKTLAFNQNGVVRLLDAASGEVRASLLAVGNAGLTLSPDGHYGGTVKAGEIVYVTETRDDQGTFQKTYTAEEFANRYPWKNDPKRVDLTGK